MVRAAEEAKKVVRVLEGSSNTSSLKLALHSRFGAVVYAFTNVRPQCIPILDVDFFHLVLYYIFYSHQHIHTVESCGVLTAVQAAILQVRDDLTGVSSLEMMLARDQVRRVP